MTHYLKKSTLLLSFALLFSGCTSYNENFECPVGKGIGCKSVTEVKKQLDQGKIDIPESSTESYMRTNGAHLSSAPLLVNQTNLPSSSIDVQSIVLSDQTVVQRGSEKQLRVWIAPYQDVHGNLHEASVVHSVIQPGYWHVQANPYSS